VVGIPFDSTITACRDFWRSNVQNVGMLIFADAHNRYGEFSGTSKRKFSGCQRQ
jgi:hypothetical protein